MTGYPIAWTDQWNSFDSRLAGSPYTAEEIKGYITGCCAQFSPHEKPLTIRSVQLVTTRTCTTRRFWLFELVTDEPSAQWFAVAGSGMGPFRGSSRDVGRWIYAQTNDDRLSATAFLDREIANHP